jgi:GR25 family glycosyltransferase involved in LPS biosynthesis
MEPHIPAFVINLQRRPDRLAKFKERCPLESVTLVPGFDAKNYINEAAEEIKFFEKVKCQFPGESAVYVSHLRIMKKIVDQGLPYGLIFEDDAEFCPGFLEKYEQVVKDLPKDTHILYIGGRFNVLHQMKQHNCSIVTENIVKHKSIMKSKDPWDTDRTAHAYILSNQGARVLLEYFNSLSTITRPIDDLMVNYCIEKQIPIYNSQPLLCYSALRGDSDIRHSRFSQK